MEVFAHEDNFPAADLAKVRQRLLGSTKLQEAGQYTLRLPLSAKTTGQAATALSVLWKIEEEMRIR